MTAPAMIARPSQTCAASYVRLIVQLLEQTGHGGLALARATGMDPAALEAAEGWIPHHQVMALWRRAREVTGDDTFGLAVASRLGPESFALLGHSLMLGQTLGESYRRAARDLHLLGDLFEIHITETAGATTLELVVTHGQSATPECLDGGIAAILVTGRRLCADPALAPLKAELRRPAPADPAPFHALFGCKVRFGSKHDRLVFAQADMMRPVFSGNPVMAELFDRQLAPPASVGLVERLRGQLIARLPQGAPSLEALAEELHISPRTLHRRLAADGLNYRQLLDDTRRQLADQYLARGDLPLSRISSLLGFSEPASLSRAYRRWQNRK